MLTPLALPPLSGDEAAHSARLAALIQESGLSQHIGELLARIVGWPPLAVTAVVVIVAILWTELTSNVATAATFMPILAALATA